uniref:1,4-dihydroxy-2-naphthoate polyprenyltransferase n=1 Tax=Vaginimicrobium propionicum TaxID=1871034 RepID=UPI0009711730|nr:1,4-dihydroxy-2-naphthoate polyprenyltransferase [Vaginimicrobium propionicum]
MATTAEWLEGARFRTLPASISPVLMGAAIAVCLSQASALRSVLAGLVALTFQIGVNFANDYSDGIRGSDDIRVGPQRLVGSKAASPKAVKTAAFVFFGIGCLAGLWLVALSGQWWLILVGAASVVAAWCYTGGKHPYGYLGLGEIFVFIFFGLVATMGTIYTQTLSFPLAGWTAASAMGLLPCAVLMCNNLRDRPRDAQVGKRTLSVRLGDKGSRWCYVSFVVCAIALLDITAMLTSPWLRIGEIAAVIVLVPCVWHVVRGASGMELVRVLKGTGIGELVAGAGALMGALIA